MHLKHDITVSTIKAWDTGRYETCVFYPDSGSDVIRVYANQDEAREGHDAILYALRHARMPR